MFEDFTFPDGTKPNWEAVSWIQQRYMKWLNEERTHTLLTFPVMTVCLLTDGEKCLDSEYEEFVCKQWEAGDSFFVYTSDNPDSVASCCRLRNEVTNNTFSSTTGLTGVQTGSVNVMTLNMSRIIQDFANELGYPKFTKPTDAFMSGFKNYLKTILDRIYIYQKVYKQGLYEYDKDGMIPATKAGFISLDKLYCTLGVNGLNEMAMFMGFEVSNNQEYLNFIADILGTINNYNTVKSEKKFKFNLELVPKLCGHVKPLLIDSKLF